MSRKRAGEGTAAMAAALYLLFFPVSSFSAAEPITVTFGEVLSDFSGRVRVGEARVAIDGANREVLVGEARDVHVFNDAGMEVFSFHIAQSLGAVRDLAVLRSGEILALAYDQTAPAEHPRFVLARHDYRGAPRGEIVPTGLPPEFAGILPNRMVLHQDRLILASTLQLLAVELLTDGSFQRGWDIGEILEIPEEDRGNVELTGFSVDGEGNLLLTCATFFRAFSISKDGSVASWGKPGGAQGTFGNTAGIAADGHGHTFVVDKLRGVVIIFDENFQFLGEFGGDPSQPGALGRPSDIVCDGAGRLYVTQVGSAGVFTYDVRPR